MSSLLSFLNQKFFSDNKNPQETAIDTSNGPIKQQWDGFMQLYQEKESIFRLTQTVDIVWASENDKAVELEGLVDSFASSAHVVMEGLLRLVNLHPSFSVAVSSYYSLITLDLARARDFKKVLFVLLQVQATLSALFQLRHIKSVTVRSEAEKTSLQQLIISLATCITNCGSDLNYFMSVSSPMRLIYVNTFEKKLMAHVNVFIKKRKDLQKIIDSIVSISAHRSSFSMKDMGRQIKSMKVNETPQQAERRFQLFLAHFLARLRTADEAEAVSVIAAKITNVKEDPKGAQSQFVDVYLGFVSKEDVFEQAGYVPHLEILTKVLNQEGGKKMGTGPSSHLPRYNKLLNMQNQSLHSNLGRIQKQTQRMREFNMKVATPFIVSVPTLVGGKRYILLDKLTTLKDPEVHQMWTRMNLGLNVEIRSLIMKLREYFADERSSSDKWVLDYVDLAHVQPMAESLESSASELVDVQKVHHFALSRPDDLSFSHWLAYWAAGWRINVTNYRDQIFSVMREMHVAFDSIHIANRAYVGVYLGSPFFIRVESLFRSIAEVTSDFSISDGPRLVELAYHVANLQEEEIIANLEDVSYILASAGEARLVGGPARVETWILPCLYLLLQRHLSVIKIAQSVVLDGGEMMIHTQSLMSIFKVFESRIKDLEVSFKLEEKGDPERQFQSFAYGMFYTYRDRKKSTSSEKTTLSTFRSASTPHIYNKASKGQGTPIDTSILAKGPGNPFEYNGIDRTLPAPNHRIHSLQDTWYGSSLQIYIQSFSADQTFTGVGETFVMPVKLVGKFEPVAPDNPYGCLMVYFKISGNGIMDLLFKGLYDPDDDSIEGELASYEGYDVDSIPNLSFSSEPDRSQSVIFSRARPAIYRFKYILEESAAGPKWSLARRRWAFATQVALLQAQIQMRSSKVIRRGIQDRRNWTRSLAASRDENPEKDDLKSGILYHPPENVRIYTKLMVYLVEKRADALGAVKCDGCDKIIRITRFGCITCRNEDIPGNAVDFCSNCIETPQLSERYRGIFAHDISHSLIRTSSHIPHFEISELVRHARILSEDTKRMFRETNADTAPPPLKYACCDADVSLPCLVCVTCSLHPLICLNCDENGEHIQRGNTSFAIHSRKHRLLRIHDSASVESDAVLRIN